MPSASTPDIPAFAGIVLAGGASARMGRDKALLPVAPGVTLLDAAVALLGASGARRIVVSGSRPGYEHVPDAAPFPGPLGGLSSVLAAHPELQGCLLMVLPVDVPRLTPAALHALLQATAAAPGACYDRHPLPLALHADVRLSARLQEVDAGSAPAAVHRLVTDLGMRRLPVHGADLTNLNTAADWRRNLIDQRGPKLEMPAGGDDL